VRVLIMLRNIEPRDLELALGDLLTPDRLRALERADLRDLRRIVTVLPADDVKAAALAALQVALNLCAECEAGGMCGTRRRFGSCTGR
jgi:hypothetical protein